MHTHVYVPEFQSGGLVDCTGNVVAMVVGSNHICRWVIPVQGCNLIIGQWQSKGEKSRGRRKRER